MTVVLWQAASHAATGQGNPYIDIVSEAIPGPFSIRYWSWRAALFGRYTVVHLHWPEYLVRSDGRWPKRVVKSALALAVVARWSLPGLRVIRTQHNLDPHETADTGWERWITKRLERCTDYWLILNEATPTPVPRRTSLTPHPHFRTWYAAVDTVPQPGRLLYFGLIRPYKNVETLIRCFREMNDPSLRLHIVGKPHDDDIRQRVEAAAAGDSTIQLDLEFVDDGALAEYVRSAEVVVLPFVKMHNSSSLLLALSLNRPAVAPDGPVVRELQAEVGPTWITSYDGELTPGKLRLAVAVARAGSHAEEPILGSRSPEQVGALTADAYNAVLRLPRRRRTGT